MFKKPDSAAPSLLSVFRKEKEREREMSARLYVVAVKRLPEHTAEYAYSGCPIAIVLINITQYCQWVGLSLNLAKLLRSPY